MEMDGIVNLGFNYLQESQLQNGGQEVKSRPLTQEDDLQVNIKMDQLSPIKRNTVSHTKEEEIETNAKQEEEEEEEEERRRREEEEEEDGDYGFSTYFNQYFEGGGVMAASVRTFREKGNLILPAVILCLYIAYVIAVILIHSRIEDDNFWCSGDGFFYILTLIILTGIVYGQIKKYFGDKIYNYGFLPLWQRSPKLDPKVTRIAKGVLLLVIVVTIIAFYVIDTVGQRRRLVSFIGVFFLIGLGYLFSYAPRKIVWQYPLWGIGIQFLMALLVLRWPTGNQILACLSDKVSEFLGYATEGAVFIFGPLAEEPLSIFAFSVLPVTIFFSFCTNVLYYFGAVQWLVIKLGWLFQITIGTGLCESMNAAGSIFLGMTESPLLVKPYLPIMTKSEIHAIMTAGYATIAGSVLAAYIALGADASLLLTASVMNAPAALGLSKLMYPNIIKSRINAKTIAAIKSNEVNALHAGCVGVSNALPLVAAIAGNLIAFISFIAFFNAIFDWGCQLVNIDEGTCSLEGTFGYVFMPLSWMMGVEWPDCYEVGQLLGLKIVVNEFVAYTKLSEFMDEGAISERSSSIATFALCGFGNISSVGIMMGGLGPLAPNRKDDMAKIAFRAMVTGSMATFMSACIAGTLLEVTSDGFPSNETTTTTMSSISF